MGKSMQLHNTMLSLLGGMVDLQEATLGNALVLL